MKQQDPVPSDCLVGLQQCHKPREVYKQDLKGFALLCVLTCDPNFSDIFIFLISLFLY